MITKPECLRRDNADDARSHALRVTLALVAKIIPKFSLTITDILAISAVVFATGSLAHLCSLFAYCSCVANANDFVAHWVGAGLNNLRPEVDLMHTSAELKFLIIFGQEPTLCVNVQDLSLNNLRPEVDLMLTSAGLRFLTSFGQAPTLCVNVQDLGFLSSLKLYAKKDV